MFPRTSLTALPTLFAALVHATPYGRSSTTVTLDGATIVGTSSGLTNSFLGLPYAEPPTGNNRFNLPVPLSGYNGTVQATAQGNACAQQDITIPDLSGVPEEVVDYVVNGIYQFITPNGEDCLNINVVQPADATPDSKLPVAVWIFGGGFQLGGTNIYDGSTIVDESILMGEPVIYVSMNYRLNAFGFLASQEVKDAGVGNLGLQDQREALRWVQKYISNFGGDPEKVTIWGESAGAISVALHMVTNGGDNEGLFRGAYMESGSPIPVGDIIHGQPYYDSIVDVTGCASSTDTLQCLRGVDYTTLMDAINDTPGIFAYQSLNLAWLPRTDGVFLTDTPQQLVLQGSVSNVPFVNGDCDDEGTLFSLALLNITTDAEAIQYFQDNYAPNATQEEINAIAAAYPSNPSDGSPFNTGSADALTPEFKRLAALQGDLVFQAPRRFFIQQQSGKQDIWVYDNQVLKDVPFLGSFHASDILNIYFSGTMTPYLINFVNNLNPNGVLDFDAWPAYTKENPQTLLFQDGIDAVTTSTDTFREQGISLLTNLSLVYPL